MRRPPSSSWLLMPALLAACANTSGSDAGYLAETTIQSTGGVAATPDGALIFVPAGAVAAGSSVTITIALDTSAQPPDGTNPAGLAYLFGPANAQFLVP